MLRYCYRNKTHVQGGGVFSLSRLTFTPMFPDTLLALFYQGKKQNIYVDTGPKVCINPLRSR